MQEKSDGETLQAAIDNPTACLAAGYYVQSDSLEVREFVRGAVGGVSDLREKAVRLYYAVRDGLRYDPYACALEPQAYLAGRIARMTTGFCVQKAILLTAACRAEGIPSRLGFADVRNHLASPRLLERMGTDIFVFHGFSEIFIEGRWLKVTPTFNRELCERFSVKPLEFDGSGDALFHDFDAHGRRHMEYIRYHGVFLDLPFERMVAAFAEAYPHFGLGDAGKDTAFAAE
jgi:transglutaminase-like putative cysteine protease